MPKDESSQPPDNEIDEADKEIEDFKRFCFMSKPLMNLTLKECKMYRILAECDRLQQDTTRQTDQVVKGNLPMPIPNPVLYHLLLAICLPMICLPIICLVITYLVTIQQ